MHRVWLAVALMASALVAPSSGAQGHADFHWDGVIPAGGWIEIDNVNGTVRVDSAPGDRVAVDGVKHWRRGRPDDVRIQVAKFGEGTESVRICALWLDTAHCTAEGYSSGHGNNSNDTQVDFTIRLPRGVNVDLNTVNGGIRVIGASVRVEAHTVNGNIDLGTSSGPVSASTVNGNVDVRMRTVADSGSLEYSTVNGNVRVYLPSTIAADVDLSTVNGHFETDYPITVSGRFDRRHLRATIGNGGRRLRARTVNGNVELRKL